MTKNSTPRAWCIFAMVGLAASLACVTRTYNNAIEVKGDRTVQEKTRWAQSFVTEARLTRLRAQVKERVPGVTDDQLARMVLRWNQTTFHPLTGKESSTTVAISVGILYDNSFNPRPIISAATDILEPEVNPPTQATPESNKKDSSVR